MGVFEFFNKRVKSLRNKFSEITEAVGKRGGIDTDINTLVNAAGKMMGDIAPIIGKTVPKLDSTNINGVVNYITKGASFMKDMYESADFDLKPITNAILATGLKSSSKAVDKWVETAVGVTEIEAATTAKTLLTALTSYSVSGITEAMDDVDNAILKAGGAASCDSQIARRKIDAVLLEVSGLSPASQVIYESSFNALPSEVHLSREDSVTVSGSFNLAATNGFGVIGGRLQDSINYALPLKRPNYLTQAAANNRIATVRMMSAGVAGLPKMTSFNYEVALDMAVHFDFAGSLAGDAVNLGMSGVCNYAIFAGPTGGMTRITSGTFAYDPTERYVDVDLGAWVPASASPILIDFQVQGDSSSVLPMTGAVTVEYIYGYHVYGKTKGSSVPRSDVTYELAGFTGSQSLNAQTFLEFIGKLIPPDGNDPMTVYALWLNRMSKVALVREVCGWLDTETYANKKYVTAGFAGGISDVARIDEWLDGVGGPFAGMSLSQIKQALIWFWQDLNTLSDSLDVSSDLNVNFAIDNGFCGDSLAV
jgi:hypothetical protein